MQNTNLISENTNLISENSIIETILKPTDSKKNICIERIETINSRDKIQKINTLKIIHRSGWQGIRRENKH